MTERKPRPSKRIGNALLWGVMLGALIVALFALPLHVGTQIAQANAASHQENLIPACGEAFDTFACAEVSLTVLLDGAPHEGMAVSADSLSWYTPQDGEVALALAPRPYHFTAAYQNRTVTLEGEAALDAENRVVLDVDNAPRAPELIMLEATKRETCLFPLDIQGAEGITFEMEQNGVAIVRQDGGFTLSVDATQLEEGFHHFLLYAENNSGRAVTHIGLRLPRSEPTTLIHTIEDFQAVRRNLSGNYLLMNDLDMSGVHDWTPIGTAQYPFRGVFDGGGHTITGLHAPETIADGTPFSIFGEITNAEIRNLIVREPNVTPEVPERDLNFGSPCAVFANHLNMSLIDRCASIGGVVRSSGGAAGGVLNGSNNSIILGVFNSTDVFCDMPNRYLPNTGGVVGGVSYSYIAYCANEGEVKGTHLSGGIVGWGYHAMQHHCVNSGYIWGSTIVGAVPAGGLTQTFDYGNIAYGYFVHGQSAHGGRAFQPGVVNSILGIGWDELKNPETLAYLGSFDGEDPEWAYRETDANGPVPIGVARYLGEGGE